MEILQQIWEQGSTQIIIIAVICVVYLIGMIVFMSLRKKSRITKQNEFLNQNKDAVRLYLTKGKTLNNTAYVKVYSVNGENPVHFPENKTPGVYLKAGENVLEVSYQYTEHVTMKKSVMHSTGIVKKKITVEKGKSYLLIFDNDQNEFVLEETSFA